jgi:hypothetical protein
MGRVTDIWYQILHWATIVCLIATVFVFEPITALLISPLVCFALNDDWRGQMCVPDEVVLAVTTIFVAMILHTNYNGLIDYDGWLTWIWTWILYYKKEAPAKTVPILKGTYGTVVLAGTIKRQPRGRSFPHTRLRSIFGSWPFCSSGYLFWWQRYWCQVRKTRKRWRKISEATGKKLSGGCLLPKDDTAI